MPSGSDNRDKSVVAEAVSKNAVQPRPSLATSRLSEWIFPRHDRVVRTENTGVQVAAHMQKTALKEPEQPAPARSVRTG